MTGRDIVVIGASMGGLEALKNIVPSLPEDLPAAIFIVLHTSEDSPGVLPDLLNRISNLPVLYAANNMAVRPGRIYIARPGQHLSLEKDVMKLSAGPKENRHRPAIDVLFRSAAASYGEQVIGVVLSGNLDDGSAGLRDIKLRGGMCIVQDPERALAASMPVNAIEAAQPEFVLPVEQIADKIVTLVGASDLQTKASDNGGGTLHQTHATYSCPACHGSLQEVVEGGMVRFRCRVGHKYSAESLLEDQAEAVEKALWAAIRSLEEHSEVAARLAKKWSERNHSRLSKQFSRRAQASGEHARTLRLFLDTTDEVREPVPEEHNDKVA